MKILLVEDNEKLARSVKKGLEAAGFAVDHLADGEIAERRIKANWKDYDLVILDLMLPHRDGLSICKNWREEKIILPVIILSAKDTVDDITAGLDCCADDYLVKPFSFRELLARILVVLRRPQEAIAEELEIGNLSLNLLTREVRRGNENIELTLKEFALLEFLMRNAGQVLSREQILSHIWDFSNDSFSNLVDVHIKNLRKKINKKNNENILETIRGIGYRFKN
jgi:DNA-binding response OmpR family regulator